jgi:hypothetical protein
MVPRLSVYEIMKFYNKNCGTAIALTIPQGLSVHACAAGFWQAISGT